MLARLRATIGVALAAALVSVGASGCGEVLDADKLQDQIKSSLENEQGLTVTSVDCPSDVDIDPGATFSCSVSVKGGKEQTATLKIRNKNADVSLVHLAPSSSSSDK